MNKIIPTMSGSIGNTVKNVQKCRRPICNQSHEDRTILKQFNDIIYLNIISSTLSNYSVCTYIL